LLKLSPLRRPVLIVVSGFSGTGKTALARGIAARLGLRVLSTDGVRGELFGCEKCPAEFGQGAYSPPATERTYRTLLARAGQELDAGRAVVLDGTFLEQYQRDGARRLAEHRGAVLRAIECRLDPASVRSRINARQERGEGESDAGWPVYVRQQRQSAGSFQPAAFSTLAAEARWPDAVVVDTSAPIAECVAAISDQLRPAGH